MSLKLEEIKKLIKEAIPDAEINIKDLAGDENHYSATIKSKIFYPEILFVPLVGYDDNLNRLGYGGGFYDRYINRIEKNKKITKIGLAFSYQRLKKIPTSEHDKKLDFIMTEKGILK